MIFNEIYCAYYNAVARIIRWLQHGKADERELHQIIADCAFGESSLTLLPSLKSGKWQLVKPNMTTVIRHEPTMPLTLAQKRWLKAVMMDKRIQLFDVSLDGLDGIEPLFTKDDILIYDQYSDADPYSDERYIKNFKTVLSAIRQNKAVNISVLDANGNTKEHTIAPVRLEYSQKDDKFRLIARTGDKTMTLRMASVISCREVGLVTALDEQQMDAQRVTVEITDGRNCFERFMLAFAHFKKRAECLGDKYTVTVFFDKKDQAEMVIRILSFGPNVMVTAPQEFKELIIKRLKAQMEQGRI